MRLTNREKQIKLIARDLMDFYGLNNWTLLLADYGSYLGYTRRSTKTITISRWYINHKSYTRMVNTILHEIAHALTPLGNPHGKEWKKKAKEIRAIPRATLNDELFKAEKEKLNKSL